MNSVKPKNSYSSNRRQGTGFLRRFLSSPRAFAFIALVFLLFILIPLAKNYSRKRLVEQEIAGIQKEIADFESKNKDLQEMINYLQSDQSLEEQARLNMGLKRPGETVAVIEDKYFDSEVSSPRLNYNSPNWKKWWQYFVR